MSNDVDEPSVSEDDCAVCGHWPAADREAMRLLIDGMPLQDDVCDACQWEFWRKIPGFLDLFGPPTKH
jgi:hypothetical protein